LLAALLGACLLHAHPGGYVAEGAPYGGGAAVGGDGLGTEENRVHPVGGGRGAVPRVLGSSALGSPFGSNPPSPGLTRGGGAEGGGVEGGGGGVGGSGGNGGGGGDGEGGEMGGGRGDGGGEGGRGGAGGGGGGGGGRGDGGGGGEGGDAEDVCGADGSLPHSPARLLVAMVAQRIGLSAYTAAWDAMRRCVYVYICLFYVIMHILVHIEYAYIEIHIE